MATEIKMPQLSDTMNAGKILSWKKKEGEQVARGEMLAEVETDKANLEIECFTPGTLLKIIVPVGSSAQVGEVIAVIGDTGEAVQPTAKGETSTPPTTSSPSASHTPSAPSRDHAPALEGDRVKVSPLARKLAAQSQVDVASLQGSGPGGRIIKKDVEAATKSGAPAGHATAAQKQAAVSPSQALSGEGKFVPLSKMRESIARRMQESISEAPHFYMTAGIDMGQAMKLRELLKEDPEYKDISVNHLIIKACAYALARETRVNCSIREGQLYDPGQINIGIITSVEDGLLIPVLKNVDRMALKDVVFEARACVDRARAGRPNASDLSGGTFSISNVGMYDVESFSAIINPGQGAILAVSSIRTEPVVKDGQIRTANIMKVTISADHRVMDAVVTAIFLKHLRTALENPALLSL